MEPAQRDGILVRAGAVKRQYLTVEQAHQKWARIASVTGIALLEAFKGRQIAAESGWYRVEYLAPA